MPVSLLRVFSGPLFVFAWLVGCSGGMPESTIQDAQVAYDEAVKLEAEGKMEEAFEQIDGAILAGGLNPDLLGEAYLLRARCYCAAGDLEAAEQDIETAERGSPNPGVWHFTLGTLLASQGEAAKSKTEFSKARKFDPSLKIPK